MNDKFRVISRMNIIFLDVIGYGDNLFGEEANNCIKDTKIYTVKMDDLLKRLDWYNI